MIEPPNGYAMRGAKIEQVQPFAFDRGTIGCVLLHGFTAAPKEMRPLGEYLAAGNYTVRGVRYAGHGTSPQDLAVFELYDRIARQVMVPRGDVIYLSTDRSLEQNLAVARESGHTRFPLCEGGDLDRVIGVVHIKDLFRAGTAVPLLERIARPIKFVPESIALDKLLAPCAANGCTSRRCSTNTAEWPGS